MTPTSIEAPKRFQVVGYEETPPNQVPWLIHDTQFGPVGSLKEPTNVLAHCWHKEQAEQICQALNLAILADELAGLLRKFAECEGYSPYDRKAKKLLERYDAVRGAK